MSAIQQIATLMISLSSEEKVTLIDALAKCLNDTKAVEKPKKKAALGTLAWVAYVKHIKETRPEAFDGLTKESDKLVIIKGIRAENPEEYVTWTDAWKADQDDSSVASPSSGASVISESAVENPKKKAKEAKEAKEAEKLVATAAKKASKEASVAEKIAKASAKEAEKAIKAAAKEAEKRAKIAAKTPSVTVADMSDFA
jgi:hypothetical protein